MTAPGRCWRKVMRRKVSRRKPVTIRPMLTAIARRDATIRAAVSATKLAGSTALTAVVRPESTVVMISPAATTSR